MSEFVTLHDRKSGAEIRIRRDTIVVVQGVGEGSGVLIDAMLGALARRAGRKGAA